MKKIIKKKTNICKKEIEFEFENETIKVICHAPQYKNCGQCLRRHPSAFDLDRNCRPVIYAD